MREAVATGKRRNYTGIALVVASVVAKGLGAIYRIPLTNILGAEGIGMYQLIFPMYALMLTLSSSGLPTSIARLISERHALDDVSGARGIVKTSAILLGILGAVFAVVLLLLSAPLASIQGNGNLAIAYVAIAPSVLFVAGSSVLKGYFQGVLNLIPNAISNIIEQVVKMAVGLVLASYLMRYGIMYAVTGAVLGVTIAELVSFVVMLVMYIRHRVPKIDVHVYDFRSNITMMLRVSLPIALSGIVFPLMQVIDSVLIVYLLRLSGVEGGRATALYGLLTGPVGTLVNMPIVVTLALAIMVVPLVSGSRARRDADAVRRKCVTSIKLSYLVCAPAFVGLFCLAGDIVRVLYPTLTERDLVLATGLLRVCSVGVLLFAEVQIYSALLEALDKARVGLVVLVTGAIIKVAVSIPLIMNMSIVGAAIANILTYLVVTIAFSLFVRRYIGSSEGLFVAVTKVLVSSLVMGCIVIAIASIIRNIYITLVVAIVVGVAIYTLSMLLLGVMDESELRTLPLGSLLIYLSRRLRFWERAND